MGEGSGVQTQINIDLVKLAEDVVAAIAAGVASSSRSVVVEVDNQLPVPLVLDSTGHSHGGFGSTLPKSVIAPMTAGGFSSQSSGLFTGAAGHVSYRFDSHVFFIEWENPEVGSNSSGCHVEPDDPRFGFKTITGSGNNSHIRFIIADFGVQQQPPVLEERFLVTLGNTPTIVRNDGLAFGAEAKTSLNPIFQYSGAKIGTAPQDRFMVAMGNRLVVIRSDGLVFGADVNGRDIQPVFQFTGARIGNAPEDRFMVALQNTLVVIRSDGLVFGADVIGRDIQPVFQFSGAKIGTAPQDRFMVAIGGTLVVARSDGLAFGADVLGRSIQPVFQFSGARIGLASEAKFMTAIGNTIVVARQDHQVFQANIVGREIQLVFSGGPVFLPT